MHIIHNKPSPVGTGRIGAVFGLAAVSLLLAGCAYDPPVDPIFRVTPPGQQTTCPSGAYNCAPAEPYPQPGTGY